MGQLAEGKFLSVPIDRKTFVIDDRREVEQQLLGKVAADSDGCRNPV